MESTLNPVSVSANPNNSSKQPVFKYVSLGLISFLVILAGVGTGYLLSGKNKTNSFTSSESTIVVKKNEAGIADGSKFSTTTDGVLEEGGIGGEGNYHLVRGSGPSQYAYLTSSVVDLSPFVGSKVEVWGETISGKKAGWLIDVGKIKVVEGE